MRFVIHSVKPNTCVTKFSCKTKISYKTEKNSHNWLVLIETMLLLQNLNVQYVLVIVLFDVTGLDQCLLALPISLSSFGCSASGSLPREGQYLISGDKFYYEYQRAKLDVFLQISRI